MDIHGPQTAQELIEHWDNGYTVWTIEMGGMGPGYEQAIQLLFIELVRDHIGKPLPTDDLYDTWGNDTVRRIDQSCGGFSGAQVGAAKQIAYRMLRDGPQQFKESIPKDRCIQVSKFFPTVEPISLDTEAKKV